MWDCSSHLTTQTSAWCGSAVSGSGFLSNIRARQSDPGLRRWQSMYNLTRETPTRWAPLSGAELRTGRAGGSFYQTAAERWLQDADERLSTQLDMLRPRDMKMNYSTSRAQMLDMMQKDAAELSLFDRSREQKELQEKVLKLESDLLQMRSTLNTGSNDQPADLSAPNSLSRTFSKAQEDFTKVQKVDAELRKALRSRGEGRNP